jgi:deoxycytidine triphosphate deaminase
MLSEVAQRDSPLTGDAKRMAAIVTQDHLKDLITAGDIIIGGDPDGVEGIKYDFRFGSKFLKASLERPVDFNELQGTEKTQAKIDPGEVVFVMSAERLKLPMDTFVVLVHKRKLSHDGIAVMGGLCVDPGYEGHLLVGLHNFSSSPFQIVPGHKLIAGLFYKLSGDEIGSFPYPATKIVDFPEELVRLIRSYQPTNLNSLNEQLGTLKTELSLLQREFSDDKKWRQDFKEDLDGLLAALKDERENRQDQYKEIETKISGIEKVQIAAGSERAVWDKIKWGVIGAIIGGVIAFGFKYAPQILKALSST